MEIQPLQPLGSCLLALLVIGAWGPRAEAQGGTSGSGVLWEALCAHRDPCRVHSVQDAGQLSAGRGLHVVQLALHQEEIDPEEIVDPEESDPEQDRCLPCEHWLVHTRGERVVSKRLLVASCCLGCEENGVAGEVVTVAPNRFSYLQQGSSEAWRWSIERTLRLSPLRLLSLVEDRISADGASRMHSSWSWESLSGIVEWTAPSCKAKEGARTRGGRFQFLPIPSVETSEELREILWATTPISSCSLSIDSTGEPGILLAGEPGEAEDARIHLLMVSDLELLLEIHDDHWSPGTRDWRSGDYLELWLGPLIDPTISCFDPRAEVRQWGIRVSDGAVFPGSETETGRIEVKRQELVMRGGRTLLRMMLLLPEPPGAITLAYADSDDGNGPERIMSTSLLGRGVAASLGSVHRVDPRLAVCKRRKGALRLRLLPMEDAAGPLLGVP